MKKRVEPTQDWQRELATQGYPVVAGVDEVGRGSWAGPVVAAAVILPHGISLPGVGDSKKLSLVARLRAERLIKQQAVAVGIGWVSAKELDEIGLSAAVTLSVERSLANLQMEYDYVMLDGSVNTLKASGAPAGVRVGADATELAVAAASVVAKVARDRYMELVDRQYGGYGFASNVGYGTAAHRAHLAEVGATSEHRRSYAPIAALVKAT